jgi:outer membrane protein assembly factor BamE (lipoprotein component of BamABCDE complex)
MVRFIISIFKKMQVYIKIFILLLLTACLREKQEGFIFDEEALSQLKVGQTSEEVVLLLGTPSFNLGDNTLVYSSVSKEFRAFFRSKVKSQLVLELKFENNKLAKITRYTKGEELDYDRIKTNLEVGKKTK